MKRKVLLTLRVLAVLGFIPFVLSGCVAAIPYAIYAGAGAVGAAASSKAKEEGPQKSQFEIRELQTRTYDVKDSKMVLD